MNDGNPFCNFYGLNISANVDANDGKVTIMKKAIV